MDSYRDAGGSCVVPQKKIDHCKFYGNDEVCRECYPGFYRSSADLGKSCRPCNIQGCHSCMENQQGKVVCITCEKGVLLERVCRPDKPCLDRNAESCSQYIDEYDRVHETSLLCKEKFTLERPYADKVNCAPSRFEHCKLQGEDSCVICDDHYVLGRDSKCYPSPAGTSIIAPRAKVGRERLNARKGTDMIRGLFRPKLRRSELFDLFGVETSTIA